MIDYLVVIDDSEGRMPRWHSHNCKENPSDYSFLGKFMTTRMNIFSDRSVYYVPDVRMKDDKRIKYGVLGWNQLIGDLFTWDSLFLAGRLHKPTVRLEGSSFNEEYSRPLSIAMEFNYDSALRTALLLTARHDFRSVLETIVGISYLGDPRLLLAENPEKVRNIVSGQFSELERLYLGRFESWKAENDLRSLSDPDFKFQMIKILPLGVIRELESKYKDLWHVALNSRSSHQISEAISSIVRRSAWRQMILGAVCTPPAVSISYSLSKMKKRFLL